MRPQQADLEYLLDRYRVNTDFGTDVRRCMLNLQLVFHQVLIYDGNMDIICNHSGILNMFANMNTWWDTTLINISNSKPNVTALQGPASKSSAALPATPTASTSPPSATSPRLRTWGCLSWGTRATWSQGRSRQTLTRCSLSSWMELCKKMGDSQQRDAIKWC